MRLYAVAIDFVFGQFTQVARSVVITAGALGREGSNAQAEDDQNYQAACANRRGGDGPSPKVGRGQATGDEPSPPLTHDGLVVAAEAWPIDSRREFFHGFHRFVADYSSDTSNLQAAFLDLWLY